MTKLIQSTPNVKASEQAFRKIYTDLLKNGKRCSPRGQLVIELENYQYELPAYIRFPSFKARKLKADYVRREFLWYLRGNKNDISICQHAKIWRDVMNEDLSINSNYGQYIFARRSVVGNAGNYSIRMRSPFEYVIEELLSDNDSRRASIPIFNAEHISRPTKDVPCTYSLNFRIREGKLNMSVHMRSQDAIFGMGNDAPCFSFIHEMVFAALEDKVEGLVLGNYSHTADSFHVYERHFEMLNEIVESGEYEEILVPKISGSAEVKHLVLDIHKRYLLGRNAWCYSEISASNETLMAYEKPASKTFDSFAFSNWLIEPELADAAKDAAAIATT